MDRAATSTALLLPHFPPLPGDTLLAGHNLDEYVGRFFAATKGAWGFAANVTLVPRLRAGMARYPEAYVPST